MIVARLVCFMFGNRVAGPILGMTAWGGAKNQYFPTIKPSTTTVVGTYVKSMH